MRDLMNTHEVADYLRIKERKVYDLVKNRRIPCTRVTGKWLFPKRLIDAWLAENAEFAREGRVLTAPPPPVVAGSHDPLLEWCLRESGCDLAMLAGGSADGLKRLAAGEALACGLHLLNAETGEYNIAAVRRVLDGFGVVVLEWAWREQGLVLAVGNPHQIRSLTDLRDRRVRVVRRQEGAGSRILLDNLLERAGVDLGEIEFLPQPARSESDLALAVLEGKADVGLAVATVARQHRLDFLPLWRERYDLVVRRRDYFETPFQRLTGFAHGAAFVRRAEELSGYDCSGLGTVVYNSP